MFTGTKSDSEVISFRNTLFTSSRHCRSKTDWKLMSASCSHVVEPDRWSYFPCLSQRSGHGIRKDNHFQREPVGFLRGPSDVIDRIEGFSSVTTYVNATDHTGTIHAWGNIHGVTPNIILRLFGTDNTWTRKFACFQKLNSTSNIDTAHAVERSSLPATSGPLHMPTRSLKSLKQSRLIPSSTATIAKANSARATTFWLYLSRV